MKGFLIVEARIGHACLMGRRANPNTLRLMGEDGRRHLATIWRASQWSRAIMIDGRCVGIGGVRGTLLSSASEVWLVLADEARRHPKFLLREGRRYIDDLRRRCGALMARIIEGDDAGRRFAERLGFEVSDDVLEWNGVRFRMAHIGDL